MIRLIIVLMLGVILYCLGSGLFYLVREKNTRDAHRLVRALTWRVGLSIGLFFLMFLCFYAGWITPHGVGQ